MNDFGLPAKILTEIKEVLHMYPGINSAKIFGSRAKGNHKRYSDVDIALYAEADQNLTANVKDALDDLDAIYNFDVILYNEITNEDIKSHIDRIGVEFFIKRRIT